MGDYYKKVREKQGHVIRKKPLDKMESCHFFVIEGFKILE